MRKNFLTIVLLSLCYAICGQPNITDLSFPTSVNLFQKHEISFKLGPYSNPYDPDTISVYAVFTGPDNRCDTVIGFYYEEYGFYMDSGDWHEHAFREENFNSTGWRIRFTPDAVGRWYFSIHAIDRYGETIKNSCKEGLCSFYCYSVANAKGFITKANSRYLRRDVVENGQRRYRSFFPVGPNVAWYSCVESDSTRPFGIYEYRHYIDSLSGNSNYMRLFLDRYQCLNLYGPEYTQIENGSPVVYFDSLINQKDAAELDYIVTYAYQNDISLMLCFFSCQDFMYQGDGASGWENNPYNTILGVPCQFFEDNDAKRVAKNLIRYIVARWGYATNIMSWELWNEVTNISCAGYKPIDEDIFCWHKIMRDHIRKIDPFKHCISTSMENEQAYSNLYLELYSILDFVQRHKYKSINNATSVQQLSYVLFNLSNDAHVDYPDDPFFMGEFGFGKGNVYNSKDPHGIDLHNSLWSSLFSTSMGPGSFWWWYYVNHKHLFKRFRPIFTFCQNLPILSDSFEAFTTGKEQNHTLQFDNNLETYYMKNRAEDTIYGWSQDTAFCYQSLRRLTDSVSNMQFVDSVVFDPYGYLYTLNPQKRPRPSSNSNTIEIPISDMPVGTQYEIHWYNAETGMEYNSSLTFTSVQQDALGRKYIAISFPYSIRNLGTQTITNTFGDAVFAIYKHDPGGNQREKEQ